MLPGGPPIQEDIVMWGNFIGRSHEDIVRTREAWKSESDRFGRVEGRRGPSARAGLPNATVTPRRNPAR
ncbi:pirin-like C-terminal cupin domain-containing protein [Streptomyces sp. PmtA]|uniref:pirin-like C-terminal cupin domain-containing protein n=1 Tax=Streptomyces sp. PmtA TaxID=3074275 RepID=UPI003014A595